MSHIRRFLNDYFEVVDCGGLCKFAIDITRIYYSLVQGVEVKEKTGIQQSANTTQ